MGSPGLLLLLLVPSEPLSWWRRSPETRHSARATRQGTSPHTGVISFAKLPCEVSLNKPLLQTEELKLSMVKKVVPNHKAGKKQIQNLNLRLSGSKAHVLSSS